MAPHVGNVAAPGRDLLADAGRREHLALRLVLDETVAALRELAHHIEGRAIGGYRVGAGRQEDDRGERLRSLQLLALGRRQIAASKFERVQIGWTRLGDRYRLD